MTLPSKYRSPRSLLYRWKYKLIMVAIVISIILLIGFKIVFMQLLRDGLGVLPPAWYFLGVSAILGLVILVPKYLIKFRRRTQ